MESRNARALPRSVACCIALILPLVAHALVAQSPADPSSRPSTRPAPGSPPQRPEPGNGRPGPGSPGGRPNPGNPGPDRPNPGNPGGGRPYPGTPGGPQIQPVRPQPVRPQPVRPQPPRPQPPRPQPPRPGHGNGGRPGGGRPPQWGRPPQNRPNYNFRPQDRDYLRRHYLAHLRYINRARRPIFTLGGFIPWGDIGYITAVPPSLYGYLPPPPPGYQVGYFDGYVVVYDPVTYFIANVVDLLQ